MELMLTLLAVLVLVMLPVLALGALLALVTRLQRSRAHVIAQQIALTDAIHAELGAVAAPVVAKPVFGPWRVSFAVPFGRPALVEQLVVITSRVLGAASPAGVRIVLTPRADVPRARAA
ncbi:MAG: hypothetical protein WED01_12215 [Candidatus Rokuibacteriota bacterium]|jgi:hypothetical protein